MSDSGGFAPPPPPPPSAGGGGQIPARGLGDILSTAFNVYKANAAKLLKIVAIVVVPLSFLSALISGVIFKPDTESITNPFTGQTTNVTVSRSFGAAIAVALIGVLIGIIITAILQAAIIRGAAEATIGDPVDVDRSFKYGFRRFGSVLLISILVGLVVGGGALVLVGVGILLGPLVVLFVLAAVVWAVFAGTQLQASVPALVVENRRGTDAMSRSWELVKGQFWHVLGTVVVAGILTGIIGGIIGALGGSFWVTRWITSAIGQIITAPFTALVTIVLYLDLRARKEALTAERLRTDLSQSES